MCALRNCSCAAMVVPVFIWVLCSGLRFFFSTSWGQNRSEVILESSNTVRPSSFYDFYVFCHILMSNGCLKHSSAMITVNMSVDDQLFSFLYHHHSLGSLPHSIRKGEQLCILLTSVIYVLHSSPSCFQSEYFYTSFAMRNVYQ